jgi:hypothetical protein
MRALRVAIFAWGLTALACASDDDGVVDTRACGSVSDDVTYADFTWDPSGTPSEALGGALLEGQYYLAQEALYGADPSCGETVTAIETRSPNARQALAIVPSSDTTGTIELVTTVNADPVRAAATYEIVDNGLSFSNLCGNASPFPEGTPFTAEGPWLMLFPPNTTCGPEQLVFERL